jgi:hypothetical protein
MRAEILAKMLNFNVMRHYIAPPSCEDAGFVLSIALTSVCEPGTMV